MLTPKQYGPILNLCFITIFAWTGVTLFYRTGVRLLDDGMMPATNGPAEAPKSGETTVLPLSRYSAIEKRNLFNTEDKDAAAAAAAAKPDPVPVEPAQITQLKLKLWGTVVGDIDTPYAIVEGKGRKHELYREGDFIRDEKDVKLEKILKTEIRLNVGGKYEVLKMEDSEKSLASAGNDDAPPAPFPGVETPPDAQRVSMQRAEIEKAMGNINDLMKQARIRPHFTDGQPDGLTLSRVQRDSLFTKLGLRSGDIITGVDGQDIRTVDDALKFYNSLKSASSATLQIRRGGSQKTVEYNIE